MVRVDFLQAQLCCRRVLLLSVVVVATAECTTASQFTLTTIALSGKPAPGVPNAVFDNFTLGTRPALANNGDVAFDALLTTGAGGVTPQNNRGIWAGGGANALTLVAREDSPAPGAAANERYDDVHPPNISNVGGVSFGGRIRGPGVNALNARAIWGGPVGSLALAARAGQPVPGAPAGTVYTDDIENPHYSDAGHLVFAASVDTPTSNINSAGVWAGQPTSLQKVILVDDPAPLLGANVRYIGVEAFSGPINDVGRAAFHADAFGAGVTSANNDVFLTSPAGGPHTIVFREGDPSGLSQANFAGGGFGEESSINRAGDVITITPLTGTGAPPSTNPSLWAGAPGALSLVARRGSQAADSLPGALYDQLPGGAGLARVINDSRDIAFLASLQGAEVGKGVWTGNLANLAALDRIAFEGEQAPGFPAGVNYSAIAFVNNAIGMNAPGSVLFTGLVSGPGITFNNDGAVWLYEKAWNMVSLVAREGQQVQVGPNDVRTILAIEIYTGFGQNDGRYESLNDSDQLAMKLLFTDNTTGIFVASKLMIPEPASCLLVLFGPVAWIALGSRRRVA